ncbi:MAG: OmpP1/FadL family transporter [Planctomycetota bacterium]|jgi:long-chain fatty acid transport protein
MSQHTTQTRTVFTLFIITLSYFAVCVEAGGLFLNEFGTPAMGNAGAGSNAEASDASTAFHNPAGMTRLDRPQLMLAGGLGYGEIRFDSDGSVPTSGGDGGNAGNYFPILGAYYVHPLDEDWRFGFTTISLAGAALDYDRGWTGRYQNDKVELTTITAMPTLAYRVNDWFSVAAGPTIAYGMLEMDVSVNFPGPASDGQATIDGDEIDVGYSLSALFELSERTRVGVLYMSEIEMDLDGDLKTRNGPIGGFTVPNDTTVPFAQFIHGSIYHDLNEKWAVVGTLGWQDWSTMDSVAISGTPGGEAALPRNWDDTWHYAAGLHYRPAPKWLLRTGVAYDTNPVDSDDRTADMPIDRQMRYAVGASYDWSESLTVGASFVYADYGSGKINGSNLSGEYDRNDVYFLGLHANWKY